jgi:hypothetical protein
VFEALGDFLSLAQQVDQFQRVDSVLGGAVGGLEDGLGIVSHCQSRALWILHVPKDDRLAAHGDVIGSERLGSGDDAGLYAETRNRTACGGAVRSFVVTEEI